MSSFELHCARQNNARERAVSARRRRRPVSDDAVAGCFQIFGKPEGPPKRPIQDVVLFVEMPEIGFGRGMAQAARPASARQRRRAVAHVAPARALQCTLAVVSNLAPAHGRPVHAGAGGLLQMWRRRRRPVSDVAPACGRRPFADVAPSPAPCFKRGAG